MVEAPYVRETQEDRRLIDLGHWGVFISAISLYSELPQFYQGSYMKALR